jgi:diamine N-acetyltransferase
MSFAARPMTGADVIPLEGVTVREAQEDFVAPNIVTIAQARFRAGAHDFCLWDGGQRVGLLALIDLAEYDKRKDADHPNGVYVWRLLIGSDFQGKGYGTASWQWLLQKHGPANATEQSCKFMRLMQTHPQSNYTKR